MNIHALIFAFDTATNTFFMAHFSPWLVSAMISFTYLADPLTIVIFQTALVIVLILIHRRYLAALFVTGLTVASVAALLLKDIVGRARPVDIAYNIAHTGSSFPSAHALVATVVYGFFGFCLHHIAKNRVEKTSIIIGTVVVVFLVGFSRVFLGVHWASDVIGGWFFGGVILYLLIMVYTSIHKRIYIN